MALGTQDNEVSIWRISIPSALLFLSLYISMCMNFQQPIHHAYVAWSIGSKSDQLSVGSYGRQGANPVTSQGRLSHVGSDKVQPDAEVKPPPATKLQTTGISGYTWYHAGSTWQSMESLMLTGTP